MTITISDAMGNATDFYNVPNKVCKAIITLLHEYENDDSSIISISTIQGIKEDEE